MYTGGNGEQHRTGSDLPTTDNQLHQSPKPPAFLEHVQQVIEQINKPVSVWKIQLLPNRGV